MNTKKTAYNNVKSALGVKRHEYKLKKDGECSEINKEIFEKTYEIYDKILNYVYDMELEDED